MSGSGGVTALPLNASPYGFMVFDTTSIEILMNFTTRIKGHRLNTEEIFDLAKQCVPALRDLGKKLHQEKGAEIAASAILKSMKLHDDNPTLRARGICDTCVNVYTQEKDGVGFIYREVNRRLRNTKSIANALSVKAVKAVIQSACDELTAYMFLLWEGLKLMFAAKPEAESSTALVHLYRGYRLPLPAYQALCTQTGKFIVFPGFTSFSINLNVALTFPPSGNAPDPAKEVDLILKFDSFSRPAIEDMAYPGFKGEREVVMSPFSVFKVVSSGVERVAGRPVVQICDIECVHFVHAPAPAPPPQPGPPSIPRVELTLAVDGLPTKRKRIVPATQLVKQLVAAMNKELQRTDLVELYDADGCVIDSDQVVADYIKAGSVLTVRSSRPASAFAAVASSPPPPVPSSLPPPKPVGKEMSSPPPYAPKGKTALPVKYRPDPAGDCSIHNTACDFVQSYGYRTVLLDGELREGVYEWTIQPYYKSEKELSIIYIGATNSTIEQFGDWQMGGKSGSASFQLWRDEDGLLKFIFCGCGKAARNVSNTEVVVPNGSTVACELDVSEGIMSIAVNGKKYPHYIFNIIAPVFLGISGLNASFTTISLVRLPAPTPLPTVSVQVHAYACILPKPLRDKHHVPECLEAYYKP